MLTNAAIADHLAYALAWLSFGAGHSILASDRVKRRLRPLFGASYRIAYNAFAAVHLGLVWALGWWIFEARVPYDFSPVVRTCLFLAYVVGWLIMLIGLRGYDLGRLAGTHQIRVADGGAEDPEDEPLRVDGLHRYVRHPLYTGGFLILWGRVDGDLELATAIWASLYLLIGSRFEERRLLTLYGAEYADYRRRVPAFFPWKGKTRPSR